MRAMLLNPVTPQVPFNHKDFRLARRVIVEALLNDIRCNKY